MALIPFAEHKLIKPDARDPKITARIGILHVDAGNAVDLYDLFLGNQKAGHSKIEAHGHIRKDGHLYQYRDTAYEADANKDANSFALSFESQGFGEGFWTKEQLDTIKELMLWCRSEHHIPLRQVSTWDDHRGGWGYHTLFGAPSHWTPIAKSCPGPDRKGQFHSILVPWMAQVDRKAPKPVKQKNNVQLFNEAVKKAAKDFPIPPTREVAHSGQAKILHIVNEEMPKS